MTAAAFIHCRVTAETKAALRTAAQRQQLTESALVRRMLELMLHTAPVPDPGAAPIRPVRLARLYVRLTTNDWASLRERAAARNMAPATYASNVLRAHLRVRAQLVNTELAAVKQSARELRAISVNVNQMAQVANRSGRVAGPTHDDLRAFLKVCEGLRDHIAALIRANAIGWGAGDA